MVERIILLNMKLYISCFLVFILLNLSAIDAQKIIIEEDDFQVDQGKSPEG